MELQNAALVCFYARGQRHKEEETYLQLTFANTFQSPSPLACQGIYGVLHETIIARSRDTGHVDAPKGCEVLWKLNAKQPTLAEVSGNNAAWARWAHHSFSLAFKEPRE